MIKAIYEDLLKEANYALSSKNLCLVHEVYGQAKMARKMCAISKEQFMQLNEMLVKNGINNPKAGLEWSDTEVQDNSITKEEWEEAEKHLNLFIAEYASIGFPGTFGLQGILVPLKKRFDSGERTRKLYEEIMEAE